MNIEDFFTTLLSSVTITHKLHLDTDKYSTHKCLNDFYDEMPDLVDDLIEHYTGIYGKVDINSGIDLINNKLLLSSPVAYIQELRRIVVEGKSLFSEDDTELLSDIDSILGLIDSTLYQLKELKESNRIKRFSDFKIK